MYILRHQGVGGGYRLAPRIRTFSPGGGGGGVLRYCLDGGARLNC